MSLTFSLTYNLISFCPASFKNLDLGRLDIVSVHVIYALYVHVLFLSRYDIYVYNTSLFIGMHFPLLDFLFTFLTTSFFGIRVFVRGSVT